MNAQFTASEPETETTIAVVGGGLAGLSMAACLGTAGIRTTVIDTEGEPDDRPFFEVDDNRTTALIQNSLSFLSACGVWEGCKEHSTPLEVMRIVNLPRGLMRKPSETDFRSEEVGAGAFGYNVPNILLRRSLCKRLEELECVDHRYLSKVTQLDNKGPKAVIKLENGDRITAELVVAADGAGSPTRQMAGIKTTSWDYPQTAITCYIEHSKPHDCISTETHYPAGPFVLVPMHSQDGSLKRSSIVWVEESNRAKRLLSGPREEFIEALEQKLGDRLGTVELFGSQGGFPLSSMIADSFHAPRLALIAEAAHRLPPIAAQGLNLSLRDVAELADQLISAVSSGRDAGSADVLRAYDKSRRFDVVTRMAAADSFNRFASNNSVVLHSIRDLGLGFLRQIGPARRALMKVGMDSPTGTPNLMTGKPIPHIQS